MAETIVFIFSAVIALGGAVSIVMARNTVYSALGLLATMFAIAVLYVDLDAHFVAAVQVVVYAGAVMTLFLFVIMVVGVDKTDAYGTKVPVQGVLTVIVAVGFFAALALAGQAAWITGLDTFGTPNLNGTAEAVADELFGTWTIVFLSTVLLLTIAAVGTIALAFFQDVPVEEVAE